MLRRCFLHFGLVLALVSPAFSEILAPAKDSGRIASCVGAVLSREHYRQHPLDDEISKLFLDCYLNALDYNHLIFLQSDVQEFQQKYATTLDDETMKQNVQPGFDIYNRYVQRFEQRIALAKELLKEKYSFDTDESILLDRREVPWPANEDEARQLWRQRIKSDLLQEKLNSKKTTDAVEVISKRYDRILKGVREEDSDAVMQKYLTALASAYDPHSDYVPASEQENWTISMNMKLSLVGIGAMLTTEDGYAKIMAVIPGGPADLDRRLKVNDRIAGVAQGDGPMVDVVDMKLNKTVELIRGKKNTEVRLLVIPAQSTDLSSRVEIKLKRDEIKLTESIAKAKLLERKDNNGNPIKLGYIDLPSFYGEANPGAEPKSTTTDVAKLVEKLKSMGAQGIVMDLRRNGGGLLSEVISTAGLFIESGPVVQVKDSHSHIKVHSDEEESLLYDGPLVVLVHHTSASAAEIFPAAMQDYGRAVIVGEQSTFGKGTVQKVDDLDRYLQFQENKPGPAGLLKITTQKFYRITGCSTQYRGVIPNIRFPSVADYIKGLNEASLKNSLPYDEVPPAPFTPVNQVTSILPELSKRSYERTSKDPEFAYIREDIERMKPRLEEKTVTLNEAKRLAEKKENKERADRRKAERLARKLPETPAVEVTLDSLDPNTPALTKKVIDDARKREMASLGESQDDGIPDDDPGVDPELNESLNILTDMLELTKTAPKK